MFLSVTPAALVIVPAVTFIDAVQELTDVVPAKVSPAAQDIVNAQFITFANVVFQSVTNHEADIFPVKV